jgi:outer membrane protein TolC
MTSTTSSGLISVFFVLFSFLVPFSVWGAQASPTLDALVAEGERSNPDIFASEARWQASVARASQAGALDDPMIMMRIQNAPLRTPLDMSQEAMSARVIGISQKLPFFGKRELMKQEALHQAEADRWLVAERRLELRRMIK